MIKFLLILVDNRISRTSFGSDTNIGPLDERVILNALEFGCLESVLRLMIRGFDINAKIGSTFALHVAVNFVCFLVKIFYLFFSIVQHLLNFYY